MLRSLLLLILFLALGDRLHAAGADYHRYHDSILVAERQVAAGKFVDAAHTYRRVFGAYDFVFARDAYNAAQIAALGGDKSCFLDCIFQCGKAGVPKNLLSTNGIIQPYFNADVAIAEQRYAMGMRLYDERIDHKLRLEFLERYKQEQASKATPGYKAIVYDNFNRIQKLAEAGRFPGEQLIGPNERLESAHVFATLYHYPYSYRALKPWLLKGLENGWVQPHALVYLYGFNQTRTSVLYTSGIPIDTTNFHACYNLAFGKQSADLDEVNRQRRLMFLHDVPASARLRKIVEAHHIDFREGY